MSDYEGQERREKRAGPRTWQDNVATGLIVLITIGLGVLLGLTVDQQSTLGDNAHDVCVAGNASRDRTLRGLEGDRDSAREKMLLERDPEMAESFEADVERYTIDIAELYADVSERDNWIPGTVDTDCDTLG
jgi:hypothetical protein